TERCSVRTRYHGDASRIMWNRPLAALVEESLLAQLCQGELHRLPPEPVTLSVDANDFELQISARGEHRHVPKHNHLHSIVGSGWHPILIGLPDHAANLRIPITQAEVPVSVPMTLEIAELAADPDPPQTRLDYLTCLKCEIQDRHRVVDSRAEPWTSARSVE